VAIIPFELSVEFLLALLEFVQAFDNVLRCNINSDSFNLLSSLFPELFDFLSDFSNEDLQPLLAFFPSACVK
jgi:hypothetical protein